MARAAVALFCSPNDAALLKKAVASLAARFDLIAVGPVVEDTLAVVFRTDVGPLALRKFLGLIETTVRFEILSYGSLVYRHGNFELPSGDVRGLRSLAQADPAFEIPHKGNVTTHLGTLRERPLS